MATATIRVCDRCGEPETRLRQLVSIPEFLDLGPTPDPARIVEPGARYELVGHTVVNMSEHPLYVEHREMAPDPNEPVFCVSRSCAVTATFKLAMAKLDQKRSGRGKRRPTIENPGMIEVKPPSAARKDAARAGAS